MFERKCNKRRVHAHNQKRNAQRLAKLRACLPTVYGMESLERRVMLSVSDTTLAGAYVTPGAEFVYTISSDSSTATATATVTAVGPATGPDGENAIEVDRVETNSLNSAYSEDDNYYGITTAGIVQFADESTDFNDQGVAVVSNTEDYSPPKPVLPASFTAGQTVTLTYTVGDSDGLTGSVDTRTDMLTLVSQTPSIRGEPAGIFNAYEVTVDETNTMTDPSDPSQDSSSTSDGDEYFAPNVGLIEVDLTVTINGSSNDETEVLSSYTIPSDTLQFAATPQETQAGETIPAFSVDILNPQGQIDTQSSAQVTLFLQGDGGTLSGTTTVSAVGGVATFTDLSVDTAGQYTLTAISSAANTNATSNQFTIDGNTLTWTGGGDGTSWSDPKNWDMDVAPENGDSLTFPAGSPLSPNNDLAGLSINTIDIQGGGYTLTGNAISLTGGLTSEAGNNTYNIDTTLVGSPTLDDVTGDLTIASVFSGDSLTVSGNGTDTFDQADTYTGTTTLSSGVTIDDSVLDGAFGDGAVTIGAGTSPVNIDDTGTGTAELDNDVTFQIGASLAIDPTVAFAGNVTIGGQNSITETGPNDVMVLGTTTTQIAGSGTLTFAGQGTAQLVGTVIADVTFVVNSGTLELDGFLDGGSATSQIVVSGGTVQMTDQTHGNGGIDVKYGTLISAPTNGSGYYGNITLEQTYPLPTTVMMSTGRTVLGNGSLIINSVASSAGIDYPTIVAPAAQTLATITNAVTFQSQASLSISGQVSFSQAPILSGQADLFTVSANDDIFVPSGLAGSGALSLGGPGTIEIDGSVPVGVTINANDSASALHASPLKFNLGATLLGTGSNASQVFSDCVMTILPGFMGSGGIDVQGGTMTTPSLALYTGTITLENLYFGGASANYPDVIVTGSVFPLGTGPIVVNNATGTIGGTIEVPQIDATAITQGLTLNNAVMLGSNSTVEIDGTVSLTNPVVVSGTGVLKVGHTTLGTPPTGGDQVVLNGGIQGSGTLEIFNGGNVTVAGVITAASSLAVYAPYTPLILAANLLAAPGSTQQVIVEPQSYLQLMTGVTGTGGIDVQGGTIQSNITTDYQGTITLEAIPFTQIDGNGNQINGATYDAHAVLGGGLNPLGTGQLILNSVPGGNVYVDASGAGQTVTLNNPVTLPGSEGTIEFIRVLGHVNFAGAATMSGGSVQMYDNSTTDEIDLTGGIQGTGNLNFFEIGTIMVTGDVAAGVKLQATQSSLNTPNVTENFMLGANLLGDPGSIQVVVINSNVQAMRTLQGSGGIEMQGGTLVSNGLPMYGGTFFLQQFLNPNLQVFGLASMPGPDVVLMSAGLPLGNGPIALLTPTPGAAPAISPPLIDASGVPGGVTLNNAMNVQLGGVLDIGGSVDFSGTTTLVLASTFATTSAGDQLTFSGSLKGLAAMIIDGPGTTTITASLAQAISLDTAGTMTGTLEIGTALAGVDGGPNQVTVTAGKVSLLSTTSGNGGISVSGGTLLSNGEPLYSGPIFLGTGGTIKDSDSTDLNGMGTGPLTISGGLLQNTAAGTATLTNAISVTGNATISSQGQRLKLENTVNLASGSSLDVTGSLVINGTLSGAGTIILDGDLLGVTSSNPNFTGTVQVNSGTVQVTPLADVLGDGPLKGTLKTMGVLQSVGSIDPVLDNPLIVVSGTFVLDGQFTFPAGITVDPGATLEISGTGTQVVDSGSLSGGGNIIVAAGTFSATGDNSGFTGSVQFQGGQVTPTLNVTDAGGIYTGSPFPAAAVLSAVGTPPASSLQGISPTFLYYAGSTATGTGSTTAPTGPGTYTVVGSFAGSADYSAVQSGPVTFTITALPPVAMNQSYSTNETTTLTVAAPGVLAGDTDPSGLALTASVVTGPIHGILTLDANGDGGFVYVPAAGYSGTDSFVYKATDSNGLSANATVTLTITATSTAKYEFSNLSSPDIKVGTSKDTISGTIGICESAPTGMVAITLDGVTQTAAIGKHGEFASTFNTSKLAAGKYTVTYTYGSGAAEVTATTTLTVSASVHHPCRDDHDKDKKHHKHGADEKCLNDEPQGGK